MNRDVEILAPAGSMECLRAARYAGADAIYLAVQNLGREHMHRIFRKKIWCRQLNYVHIHGRKDLYDGEYTPERQGTE